MHNFNRIRKMIRGGSAYLGQTDSLAFFNLKGITPNQNVYGSTTPVSAQTAPGVGQTTPAKTGDAASAGTGALSASEQQAIAGIARVGTQFVNDKMYYSDDQNTVGQVMDSLSGLPIVGPIASLLKSAGNYFSYGLGSELDKFSMDQGIAERIGGGYTGAIANMNKAQQMSGKTAIFGAHREGSNSIAKAQKQLGIMANIDVDNQNRLAMGANTQLNHLRYGQTLNGGLDARYLRAAKAGIKLEHLNRIKHLKIKQIVNVDTKQIEEFEKGGSIKSEWKPEIILDWKPEIILFKDGGKSDKKPKTRTLEELILYAKEQNPRFVQRMSEPIKYLDLGNGDHATHLMAWEYTDDGQAMVFPTVMEDAKGNLYDYKEGALDLAKSRNDYLIMSPEEAEVFTVNYKQGWSDFFKQPVQFKDGGKTEELVKLEETSQKNVIPEGALHKNKHHIENTEGLTQKGIPVIDNEGEQQAEIELNEIIFTLEVTKKLEELHKIYKEGSNKERDEAAIEAGKLLVQEILFNTDDRTGLIAKCEKGGKLDGNVE